MVLSYRDKRTRDFAAGKWVIAFSGIERPTCLKLDRLEAATARKDLAVLPGDRKEQYSIRINDQRRIRFEWLDGTLGPLKAEIVDYR